LRNVAEKEAVVLYGTIWVIEQLIVHNFIAVDDARRFYLEMKEKKRRLPWKIANAHLDEIEKSYKKDY